MMYEPLLVILAGLLDRIRGDAFTFIGRAVEKLLYGWVIAALFGFPFEWITLGIMVGILAGSSPGWGDTWGALLYGREINPEYDRGHFWQVGILKTKVWPAAIVRGAIWGLPVALFGVFEPVLYLAVPIFITAYIGGAVLARILRERKIWEGDSWANGETIRGVLAGLLTWGAASVPIT